MVIFAAHNYLLPMQMGTILLMRVRLCVTSYHAIANPASRSHDARAAREHQNLRQVNKNERVTTRRWSGPPDLDVVAGNKYDGALSFACLTGFWRYESYD